MCVNGNWIGCSSTPHWPLVTFVNIQFLFCALSCDCLGCHGKYSSCLAYKFVANVSNLALVVLSFVESQNFFISKYCVVLKFCIIAQDVLFQEFFVVVFFVFKRERTYMQQECCFVGETVIAVSIHIYNYSWHFIVSSMSF